MGSFLWFASLIWHRFYITCPFSHNPLHYPGFGTHLIPLNASPLTFSDPSPHSLRLPSPPADPNDITSCINVAFQVFYASSSRLWERYRVTAKKAKSTQTPNWQLCVCVCVFLQSCTGKQFDSSIGNNLREAIFNSKTLLRRNSTSTWICFFFLLVPCSSHDDSYLLIRPIFLREEIAWQDEKLLLHLTWMIRLSLKGKGMVWRNKGEIKGWCGWGDPYS